MKGVSFGRAVILFAAGHPRASQTGRERTWACRGRGLGGLSRDCPL